MQGKWRKVIESYQRVQVFLGANPPPAPASYAEPKEILESVTAKLGDYSTEQVSGRRLSQAEMKRQRALIRKLREHHLRPIAAIARAHLSTAPGIEEALRMPAAQLGPSGQITAAKSIRSSVGLYQPVFLRNGRPENFLEQLDAAIAAVVESVHGRGSFVRRHVAAKAGIRDELRRGRRAIDMLDAIVRVAFEGKADVLAAWDVAKRVQSLPVSSASSVSEEPAMLPEQKLSAA